MLGAAPADGHLIGLLADERPAPVRTFAPVRRVLFLDASRGVAVVAMLVANLVNVCLRDIPGPLAHNQGDVLRAFDLPAPVFQLLIGVSLGLFLAQRRRAGRSEAEARADALRRFALLILLGMALDGIGRLSPVPCWGVLQTLGLGGIVATALAGTPRRLRGVIAVVVFGFYSGFANGVVHARPDAALAFVPLTLAGSVLGDAIASGAPADRVARLAAGLGVVAALVGIELEVAGVPFNKVLGTSSFVAVATGAGAAVLAAAAWWEARGRGFPPWLLLIGRNALTAWVLLHLLVYYPAWIVFPSWGRLALAPGLVSVAAVTATLCAGTVALGRRGIRVPV